MLCFALLPCFFYECVINMINTLRFVNPVKKTTKMTMNLHRWEYLGEMFKLRHSKPEQPQTLTVWRQVEKTKAKKAGTGLKTNSSSVLGIRELETSVQKKKSLQSLKTRTVKRTTLLIESNLWKQQSATKTRGEGGTPNC